MDEIEVQVLYREFMSEHQNRKVFAFFNLLNKLKLATFWMSAGHAQDFILKHKITSPLGRTKRKARTTGHHMHGTSIYSDNAGFWMGPDSPAKKKLNKRMDAGLCIGCGNSRDECRCKRKSND